MKLELVRQDNPSKSEVVIHPPGSLTATCECGNWLFLENAPEIEVKCGRCGRVYVTKEEDEKL